MFILSSLSLFNYMYVCICMRVCACERRCLQSPEVVGHLAAGLIGSYVMSNMVAGNRTLGLHQNNESS